MDQEKVQIFNAARKVAGLVFEYASPDVGAELWLEDRREEGVNPFYSQTKTGLFLEMYYGQPSAVWTPWGKYGFGGSGSGWWNKVIGELLGRLGAVEYQAEQVNDWGVYGPVYAIHRVDDLQLPDPVVRPHDEFIDYDTAKKEWEELLGLVAA